MDTKITYNATRSSQNSVTQYKLRLCNIRMFLQTSTHQCHRGKHYTANNHLHDWLGFNSTFSTV